ncbi:hypothetical protein T484DRAFT_1755024 [Baffinella frigidus]|nr:hypothetical protein T484DRAFT_1755024 [Cryptophyta sp. CCMP2293]
MDLIGAVIAANPCPPLPLKAMRHDRATEQDVEGYLNTHHILMQSYAFAIQRNNPGENLIRQATQTELTNVLMATFASTSEPPNPEKLYTAAGTFTRNYLHSFMPKMPVPDARFAPYDEIARCTFGNNPIVHAACEHLAGMIYYDECPVGEDVVIDTMGNVVGQRSYADVLKSLENLPYSTVLCKYADVHRGRMILAGGTSSLTQLTEE